MGGYNYGKKETPSKYNHQGGGYNQPCVILVPAVLVIQRYDTLQRNIRQVFTCISNLRL